MRTFTHPNKTATEPIELFKQVLNNENYYFPLDFTVGGAVASFGRRLEWPDDFFRVMWSAKYMQKEYEGSEEDINKF